MLITESCTCLFSKGTVTIIGDPSPGAAQMRDRLTGWSLDQVLSVHIYSSILESRERAVASLKMVKLSLN